VREGEVREAEVKDVYVWNRGGGWEGYVWKERVRRKALNVGQ
jgi:hypothetical protein